MLGLGMATGFVAHHVLQPHFDELMSSNSMVAVSAASPPVVSAQQNTLPAARKDDELLDRSYQTKVLASILTDRHANRIVYLYGPPGTGKAQLLAETTRSRLLVRINRFDSAGPHLVEDLSERTPAALKGCEERDGEGSRGALTVEELTAFLERLSALVQAAGRRGGEAPPLVVFEDEDAIRAQFQDSPEAPRLREAFGGWLRRTGASNAAKVVLVSNSGCRSALVDSGNPLLDASDLEPRLVRFVGVVDPTETSAKQYLQARLEQQSGVQQSEEGVQEPAEGMDASIGSIIQVIGSRFSALHRVSERIVSEEMAAERAVEEELRLPTMHVLKELRKSDEQALLLWQLIKIFRVVGRDGQQGSAAVVPFSQLLRSSPFNGEREKLDAFLARYHTIFFTYGTGLPLGATVGDLNEKDGKFPADHVDQANSPQTSVSSLELLGYVGFANPVFGSVFERLRHDEEVQREMWQKNRRRCSHHHQHHQHHHHSYCI